VGPVAISLLGYKFEKVY